MPGYGYSRGVDFEVSWGGVHFCEVIMTEQLRYNISYPMMRQPVHAGVLPGEENDGSYRPARQVHSIGYGARQPCVWMPGQIGNS